MNKNCILHVDSSANHTTVTQSITNEFSLPFLHCNYIVYLQEEYYIANWETETTKKTILQSNWGSFSGNWQHTVQLIADVVQKGL